MSDRAVDFETTSPVASRSVAWRPGRHPAREQRHLDRASGALAAPAREASVQSRRPMGERGRAEQPGPGAEPLAARVIERRLAEQTFGQGADVEPGSPDHHGLAPLRAHPGEPPARVASEPSGAVALPRVDQVDPEMRHAGELGRFGFRGADIEPPVHLTRVRADDGDGLERGPGDRDGGLTDARTADESGGPGAVSSAQISAPARPSAAARWWAARARRARGATP